MHSRLPALCASIAVVVTLTGCSAPRIVLIDEQRAYKLTETADIIDRVEPVAEVVSTSNSTASRTQALAALRREGPTGNESATLITRAFPPNTRGVPFYVERARVDGSAAWLVVEAIGPVDKPLSDERLWVLNEAGDVLFSATR